MGGVKPVSLASSNRCAANNRSLDFSLITREASLASPPPLLCPSWPVAATPRDVSQTWTAYQWRTDLQDQCADYGGRLAERQQNTSGSRRWSTSLKTKVNMTHFDRSVFPQSPPTLIQEAPQLEEIQEKNWIWKFWPLRSVFQASTVAKRSLQLRVTREWNACGVDRYHLSDGFEGSPGPKSVQWRCIAKSSQKGKVHRLFLLLLAALLGFFFLRRLRCIKSGASHSNTPWAKMKNAQISSQL